MKADELLKQMGIDPKEAIETDADLSKRKRRDPRICICGHGANRHIFDNGVWACAPSRLVCACQGFRPVLEVEDTRPFLRKSSGPGVRHALIRGLSRLVEDGRTATWIEDPKCEKCGSENQGIVPVAFTFSGRVAYSEGEMSGKHAFLCQGCLEEIV
jgi:hypothetical protein